MRWLGTAWACGLLMACWSNPRSSPSAAASGAAAAEVVVTAAESIVSQVSAAITEMDLPRARELLATSRERALSVAQTEQLALERARLALYAADCDSAVATLEGLRSDLMGLAPLAAVALPCSQAVAGAAVIEDSAQGVWLRFQDSADAALAPFIIEVVVAARSAVLKDLGVDLPRPLRVDVVRDLFSLAAVSGLPVDAAETTGTVAVARWGRVTFLSPSAAPGGYPWQDTMAHELVHLGLSRVTRDFAPLWLQEGVAKRQESRWREPRPFDLPLEFDRKAFEALRDGQSVGIDNLGPSIAMLPSATDAGIAFAEVSSFINFWIKANGRAGFRMLLEDLRTLGERDANPALLSVTGRSLSHWIALWKLDLLQRASELSEDLASVPHGADGGESARVGELLYRRGHAWAATAAFEAARVRAAPPADPAIRGSAERQAGPHLRALTAKSLLATGRPEAAAAVLGTVPTTADATWFALHARLHEGLSAADRQAAFDIAVGLDPWSDLAACRGLLSSEVFSTDLVTSPPGSPSGGSPAQNWQELCQQARSRPTIR